MKKVYLLVVVAFVSASVFGQTDFTIGTGTVGNTGTGYPCPLQDYYEGSRMQYLYRASELHAAPMQYLYRASELHAAGMTADTIKSIKFFVNNLNSFGGSVEQLRISIGSTTDSSLGTATWQNGLTPVYGPINYPVIGGSNVFNFSTPFYWDGTSNIVVEICNGDPNNPSYTEYTGNPTIPWTTNLGFNASNTYRADNLGNLCGTLNSANSGTPTARPNITFSLDGGGPLPNVLYLAAYVDSNLNNVKDSNEKWFPFAKFKTVKPGVDSFISNAVYYGKFAIGLDTGTYYTTAAADYPYYYHGTGTSYIRDTTSHATYGNVDSAFFPFQTLPGVRDASVSLYTFPRPDPWNYYYMLIYYKNVGTDTIMTGQVELIKSHELDTAFVTLGTATVNGDTIRWNFTNLLPNESRLFPLEFYLPLPYAAHIGDSIISVVKISTDKPDTAMANNYVRVLDILRSSYDPNDKTESHAGKITTTEVANGDYLTYTIRFQNTGNDTAFNVYLHDTLDSKLDWNTMEMLTASEDYQMTMNNGKCLWAFNNINLLDSNHNEPASHGYLVYRIKPKPTVQAGDVINNGAFIYFDYNLPIATNVEKTTVVADAMPLKLLTFTAKKDGKVSRLQWNTSSEINVDRFEVQRSGNGREFAKIGSVKSKSESGVSSYDFTDEQPETKNVNYYRLKMIDKDGSFAYSPIREVSFSILHFAFSIYPNPVKDKLQVLIESENKEALQVQVVAYTGKVLLTQQWNVSEGNTIKTLNTTALQSGNYYLRITSSRKEQSAVKFEKL